MGCVLVARPLHSETPAAIVPGTAEITPPAAAFMPIDMLRAKHLNYTGSFFWDRNGKPDPNVSLDYMEVEEKLWVVQRYESSYRVVTDRDELNRIVNAERKRKTSDFQVVPYTGKWTWKHGEKLEPKKFMGEYINLLATNVNGQWFVLDNRPLPGRIMGAMTTVTNEFQFLLITDETIKSAVRQANGELLLEPPPGVKDPPKKPEGPPLGV